MTKIDSVRAVTTFKKPAMIWTLLHVPGGLNGRLSYSARDRTILKLMKNIIYQRKDTRNVYEPLRI